MNWFIRYSYSSAFEISYLWSSDIEEYSIPSKCRNVEERLILLITTTVNYQTHLIWFNDNYQIEKSMVCDSLINNQANDWWIDCWIDWMVNPTWFLLQVNRILSILVHCCYYPLLLHFFYAVNNSYSIRRSQYPISISMIVLYYLSIINGFTNVNHHQQISIHSFHSIVSLSSPIFFFLIIRSNQFSINIEQILVQTIIWVWLVDWNHCHL